MRIRFTTWPGTAVSITSSFCGRKELPTSEFCCTQQHISRTWVFGEQCSGDDRSGIIVRKKYCHCPCCEGSCPCVWFLQCTKVSITKDLIHSVRHAHSEYALFLENERKQALVEEKEKKNKEEAAGAMRVEQRTSKRLHEQLAEQVGLQLETVQMAEQETARQLIAYLSKSLYGFINKGPNH